MSFKWLKDFLISNFLDSTDIKVFGRTYRVFLFSIQNYLLGLRETLQLVHRGLQSQVKRQPKIGEIQMI